MKMKKMRLKMWMKNKRIVYPICIFILAVALLLCGVSLAYLRSSDTATNTIAGNDVHIKLYEPNWYVTGSYAAEKLEPGMEIPKDPYVSNLSDTPVFIRLRLVVNDENGTAIEGDRYAAIMAALYCESKDNAESYSLFKVEEEDGDYTYTSNHPYFYYADGWLYFVDSVDETQITYGVLNEELKDTPNLFDKVMIPVYDSIAATVKPTEISVMDIYTGNFDSSFSIEIETQAIAVGDLSVTQPMGTKNAVVTKFATELAEIEAM